MKPEYDDRRQDGHQWAALLPKLLTVFAASLLLTSCVLAESFAEGPLAVRDSGGSLQIAVCDELDVVEIEGDVRTSGGDSPWETFLLISGNANLARGTSFSSMSIPEGLVGRFDDLDAAGIDSLFFSVEGADDSADGGFTFSAYFEVDGSLPTTGWLQTGGKVTEEPCG
ncbi:hypothetical protein [Pseudolysinimonas yzui]|uniref:Uncharacterized protein n=1 Tax=Pseudolysinimonas yzui TaxID=2708254 RepID=A0A8J3GRN6_9MICO|nr:hypothetical protein [Pseudolysinimonas yzui]GHF21974.1 hypothetical protein GCM10011600_23800 [Pseudolysinimonas yzui]